MEEKTAEESRHLLNAAENVIIGTDVVSKCFGTYLNILIDTRSHLLTAELRKPQIQALCCYMKEALSQDLIARLQKLAQSTPLVIELIVPVKICNSS